MHVHCLDATNECVREYYTSITLWNICIGLATPRQDLDGSIEEFECDVVLLSEMSCCEALDDPCADCIIYQ